MVLKIEEGQKRPPIRRWEEMESGESTENG